MQGAELRPRHGEKLAERRMRALVGGQVGLGRARHAGAKLVVALELRWTHSNVIEQPAIVR